MLVDLVTGCGIEALGAYQERSMAVLIPRS
jgi:hypothetical protein